MHHNEDVNCIYEGIARENESRYVKSAGNIANILSCAFATFSSQAVFQSTTYTLATVLLHLVCVNWAR